jgi:hypothetical protein
MLSKIKKPESRLRMQKKEEGYLRPVDQHVFSNSALHAAKGGFEVYRLMDTAGDSTNDAHIYGGQKNVPGRSDSDNP